MRLFILPGCGGNTTTSVKSRKFFRSPNMRNKIVEYVGPEFADIMAELLENDRIILALINCSQEIKVDKLKQVCDRSLELLLKELPRRGINVTIPPTQHELLSHSVEKIIENGN